MSPILILEACEEGLRGTGTDTPQLEGAVSSEHCLPPATVATPSSLAPGAVFQSAPAMLGSFMCPALFLKQYPRLLPQTRQRLLHFPGTRPPLRIETLALRGGKCHWFVMPRPPRPAGTAPRPFPCSLWLRHVLQVLGCPREVRTPTTRGAGASGASQPHFLGGRQRVSIDSSQARSRPYAFPTTLATCPDSNPQGILLESACDLSGYLI